MSHRHLQDAIECLYLAFMLRWEKTAPADGHQGLLDGRPERNTQMSRMTYILNKIAVPRYDDVFGLLARHARRSDGKSYFSKDATWMIQPVKLASGWYFEGCCSLQQKQAMLQHVTKLGLSGLFAACLDDFVAGKGVLAYLPTDEEQRQLVRKWDAKYGDEADETHAAAAVLDCLADSSGR